MELGSAKLLAEKLMKFHELHDWKFEFDSAYRRFGLCDYGRKVISLSKHLVVLNNEDSVKDTILHEIAHALTPGHHHDKTWKKKAIEIGCNGKRCFTEFDTVLTTPKYIATCKSCNKTYKRFKRFKYDSSCGYCGGPRYNKEFKLEYIQNKEGEGRRSG